MSTQPRVWICGWGRYSPRRVLTNDELSVQMDTSDEWIRERTGIRERHLVAPTESTATMAIRAAENALQVAGADPLEVDLIVVATASPDYLCPATACLVQVGIGATRAAAFDLEAGCTGFIYALVTGASAIESGRFHQVLAIGAETISRFVDWTDRNTCVLFGDGAGAVLLRAGSGAGGIISTALGADGTGAEALIVPAGGSRRPPSAETVAASLHTVRMDGRQVFRFATRIMPSAVRRVVRQAGLELKDIDLVIAHQANLRILQEAAGRLGMPMEKMFCNIERYGNTSAASIPIALCEAVEEGKLVSGQRVVLVGFGAGLTWGAVLVDWSGPPAVRRDWRWIVAALRRRWPTLLRRVRRRLT
jgi:3-oxoacyl-[acyl-carrier-protein] synthase-3